MSKCNTMKGSVSYQDAIMIPLTMVFALMMFYSSTVFTDIYYQTGAFLTGVLVLYFMVITYIHIYKFAHGNYKYRWYLP